MISVCIATHNGQKYILEQLQSILQQIDNSDEILISDDNSSDDTLKILNSIKDNRIKIYHNNFHSPIKNFEFLCTLLINFDIYEQGEIFASVNFNQKPVNRSLYYDIFGSSPKTERNELKLSHDLVGHLNYNDDSVLKGLIDMLGERNGIVSQSAVMENIMKLFGRGKVWNDLYLDYRDEGENYKLIGQFLRLYFRQIKNTFNEYWPKEGVRKSNEYHSVLIKTTGMGAFIKLINDIYKDINSDHKKTKIELEQSIKEIFGKIEKNKDLYFDKESAFVKGAGQGLQAKLYKRLAFDLGYRQSPD
jgi:DGQHR domain-containing protein